MKFFHSFLLFLVFFLAVAVTGTAQDSTQAVIVSSSQKLLLSSSFNHKTYEVQVFLPDGYDPADSLAYPALYLLDGNLYGPLASSLVRLLQGDGLIMPLVIIGIGYPVQQFQETYADRSEDFTPTRVASMDSLFSQYFGSPVTTGGAGLFLQVLQKEIIPLVAEKYKVNQNRALFGHSNAGLFATHLLLQKQESFQSFMISSPTLDWDERFVIKEEQTFWKSGAALPAKVFFSAGLQDEKALVAAARSFSSRIKSHNYKKLLYREQFFPGEKHMSVVPESLKAGLLFFFGQEARQQKGNSAKSSAR